MATESIQTTYKTKAAEAQKVSMTSTAAVLSAAISNHIRVVRYVGSVDFWLASGSSTVAASSTGGSGSIYVPAGVVEYKNFDKNSFLSVIANGSSGFVGISEETQ